MELVYALDVPGRVDLDIFDVSGRKVTTLASAVQSAGPHRALWDGTGASGRMERNGVYFARLAGPSGTSTVRLVRVR
jgi:flagellar hook assembly protein FlgD